MAFSALQRPSLKLFAVILSAVSGPAFTSDASAVEGNLWETTSQISMEGMPMQMPVQRLTRCIAKDWSEPPGSGQPGNECTTSDFMHEDNVITWTSVCADGGTGQGKITFVNDTYTGAINYTSSEGNVVINLTGKIIGECDNPK